MQAVNAVRGAFVGIAAFSGIYNVLALTGSLFMLQVYDRVLTSRSVPTLIALSVIALGMFAIQGLLDWIRQRLLVRVGRRIDEQLSDRVFQTVLELPMRIRNGSDGLSPIRDLDSVRAFMSSQGPVALLDLPWMPIYLAFVFFLHPWLGWLATAGAVLLIIITLITEQKTRDPATEAAALAGRRLMLAESGRRNAEVARAMGFGDKLNARWQKANQAFLNTNDTAADVGGGLGALSKVLRIALQSAMLGLGAYLTIKGEVSPGAIIAASITAARALAPIELAIANWKGFVNARQAKTRLDDLLKRIPAEEQPLLLPAPVRDLRIEGMTAGPPVNPPKLLIKDVTFGLRAGQGLGVIGPSGAGKSSLARAIVGVWPILRGDIRLDGAALDQWSVADLGRHIGYLPQDIELFDGTIAENIARFDDKASAEDVIAAAKAADVDDLIRRFPDGYETRIGETGTTLSAGQRQRVALARALYGNPFLVVLDEPNSNLDAEGEMALTKAIAGVRQRGGVAIIIAHRQSAVQAVDILAFVNNGVVQHFGPKEEVLRKLAEQRQQGAAPRRTVGGNALTVVGEQLHKPEGSTT
ncbi:MAG: type I secretion system permease/ATPase [Bosea sp. (in: a-proteobacteria)]